MKKIWVISDTHFYHANMMKFEDRPEDFDNQIIRNWNDKVGHDDIVIHLGDIIFGNNKEVELPKLMRRLNGTKILTIGNHDNFEPQFYLEAGFDFVVDYFVLNGIAFSHAPVTPLPEKVKLNVHGHFHRSAHRNGVFPDRFFDAVYYTANRERYIIVQIEDTLSPFALNDVLVTDRPFEIRKR